MHEIEDKVNPQTILMWRSPLRAFVHRTSDITRFYIIIALLLSIIVALFSDFILLLPIWVMVFVGYVFTVSEPPEVTHKITEFGLETAGATVLWADLSHFYFIERYHYQVLVVVSVPPYNSHIFIVVPEEMKQQITNTLVKHIIYFDHAPRTLIDKMIDAFMKLVPQEDVHPHHPTHPKNQNGSKAGAAATL